MPTLHPVDLSDLVDDRYPDSVCDRCGDPVSYIEVSAGLAHWSEWAGATLCPDCWAAVNDDMTAEVEL